MNIQELHINKKSVSLVPFFNGDEGVVKALQIEENQELKEHVTKVPALLICIEGKVVFEDENGTKETILPGDYVRIPPQVKHKVNAILKSNLILVK